MPDEIVTLSGDAVKSLDEEGKIGGYLVLFSTADAPDLVGDFFTADTDFGTAEKSAVWFQHARDPQVQYSIGEVALKKTDVGVWAEGYLNLRDQYVQAIWQMAKAGKLGWSSGTAPHLVERERVGNAKHVKRWHLGLDATLTPNPAEPRTQAMSLKALMDDMSGEPEAQAEADLQSAPVQVSAPVPAPALDQPVTDEVELKDNLMTEELKAQLENLQAEVLAMKSAPAIPATPVAVTAVSEDQSYLKAFESYARHNDKSALKALGEASAGVGGALVPTLLHDEIVLRLSRQADMRRSGARVVAYSGTDSVEVPGMTNSIAATLVAEAGALPINQDPAFATVTFTPYKYGKIVQVSQELASDSRFDIMNQVLIPDTANAFTLTENTAFFTGTGTAQPQGITVGATLGVTCASATLITADEIIDLYYSLPEQYRMNAVWMMNPATEQFIRKLKFTAGTNDYLWSPGFSERPATILGRPVFTAAGMPTIAAAARTICFYDPAAYWVMDFGGGMMMQRLDELYAGNDQVGFKFTKRMDGRVVNADGTRYLRQL